MKLNWKALIALLAVLSLIAAACGDDDAETETGADDTEQTDDTSSDDSTADDGGEATGDSLMDGEIACEQQYAGESVSIFSPVRDSENDTPIADFVAAYQPLMDCTGVEIVWQGTDQIETEINVRLEGGDPPDVIDYPQPGLMNQHVAQGHLFELPADVAAHLATDYISGWDVYGTVDDTIYGLPGRSNIKSLVWYSPPAFEEAGYEVPTSLDELRALSDQNVADGGTPWCVGAESGVATGWVLTDWIEDFMLRINGEEVYDQWVNHEIPFNDPQVVAAVDEVGSYVKNPDYLGGENNVKAIATTKFQDGGLGVATGDCFMHRQASFYVTLFPEDAVVDFFYLPSPPDGPAYMLGGGDIYAAATDRPATYDVIRYTGSLDYQSKIVNSRNELVPHLELDVASIEDPFTKKLSELQLGAEVFRFDGSDLMPGSVGAGTVWTEVTAWVIGGETQTFVDNVEASWPS